MKHYFLSIFTHNGERALNLGKWDASNTDMIALAIAQLNCWAPEWKWSEEGGIFHGKHNGTEWSGANAYLCANVLG